MGKLISRNEFKEVPETIYYLEVENTTFRQIHRDLIVKWLERHCNKSWVYWDSDHTYCFGALADFTMFKMWIKGNPFINRDGEMEGTIDDGTNP